MTAHALTRQVRTGGQTDGSRTYIANRGSSHIECITAIHPNSDAARETPKQYGVRYDLVVALIEKESGYKFDKVGDDGHSIGYMQIYEECHRDRMERLNVTDLTNPYQNVLVGIDYLSELIERYGTIQDALAAYNYGEQGAKQHLYEPEGTGMSELLERHVSVGGSYRTTDLIRPTQYSHIDIIPANGYLMQTDMKLLLKQEANQVTRLRDALEEISEAYDYCICDCGRLLDMVVINILLAAELVIAPVKVGGYENEAIHNLQEQVDDLREINPELRIKGLVTMRQKNKTSLDFEEWMKTSSGFDMFVTPIRRSIVAEKASMRMAVLPQFSKNCIVSQDYRNVVHELLKEMEG